MSMYSELIMSEGEPKSKKRKDAKEDIKRRPTAPKTKLKRPEGMSFETFKLLKGHENSHELVAALTPSKSGIYDKKKAKVGLSAPRKYQWVPFVNAARNDNLQLYHWERKDRHYDEYKYAQWNRVLEIPMYTDEEYEAHFKSDSWSREETDYLFEIGKRFDLRWPVIRDRYDTEKFKKRSVVDMKERFYDITNFLALKKDPNAKVRIYDAANEHMRRRQLRKQWKRTPEEIQEEMDLIKWEKHYEKKQRQRQMKANELQSLMDTLKSNDPFAERSPVKKVERRGRKPKIIPTPKILVEPRESFSRESVNKYFKLGLFKTAGPHLRSEEFMRFRQLNSKKEGNVGNVIEAAGFNKFSWPHASSEIVNAINNFRKDILILQDLKESLQAAEYELHLLKRKHPRKKIEMLPEFKQLNRVLHKAEFGGKGQPRTKRRFSSLIVTK